MHRWDRWSRDLILEFVAFAVEMGPDIFAAAAVAGQEQGWMFLRLHLLGP